MEEILSQLSNKDLLALQNKDFANMSTEGLQLLQGAEQAKNAPERFEGNWGEVGMSAANEFIPSAINAGADIVEAIMSPIETGKTLLALGEGALTNLLPQNWADKLDQFNIAIGLPSHAKSEQMAEEVGKYFVDKYKDEESIKHVLATDPASVLLDIGMVLSGGGAAVTKVGTVTKVANISKAGDIISKTSSFVDPVSLGLKASLGVGNAATKITREGLGVSTGAGSKSIQTAFEAARKGGVSEQQFLAHLRGGKEMGEVLDIAIADLNIMKKQKLAEYKANSVKFKADKTILLFDDIDKAITTAEKLVKYKGKVKNPEGAKILSELKKVVDDWKKLDSADFHTPEGLDALKQRMWSVMEGVDKQSKTAQSAANAVYNATKKTIVKQSPGYAKLMQEYADASDLILQIERTLSMGKKATPDTAIRKLQAIMRNNVSTNYGQRLRLADELEAKGGGEFMPGIAGQQLQAKGPQGLARTGMLPIATIVGTGGTNIPAMALSVAASSPRVVGEVTAKVGAAKRILDSLPVNYQGIQSMLEVLYQIEATQENKD
jgi:hypothetical protein